MRTRTICRGPTSSVVRRVCSTRIGAGTRGIETEALESAILASSINFPRESKSGAQLGGIKFSVRGDGMRAYTLAPIRFPDGVDLFPDHAKRFPCYGIKNSLFVLLGNCAETLDKS